MPGTNPGPLQGKGPLPVTFACVFASPAVTGDEVGDAACSRGAQALLLRAIGTVAGLDLPWRRRLVRVTAADGREGWAAMLPADAPAGKVNRAMRQLARRGAGAISVSPVLGAPGSGLHLWMAASLRAALLLATPATAPPRRALVVGVGTPAGRLALAWLAGRARYVSVGEAPGPRGTLLAERLLADLGVAVQWEPVDVPGPAWEGDLVVWADGRRSPGREIRAPVWLCCSPAVGARPPSGVALVVKDALMAGVGLAGIPSWWWTEWGWPAGFLPAGGLEAALWGGGRDSAARPRGAWRGVRGARGRLGEVPGPAGVLDRVWLLAVERGWALAGAVLAPVAGATRVAWLTGMRGPHIIGDAVG